MTSYYLNVTDLDLLIIPLIFIFLSCHEKAHDNKVFSRENSELIMNHESQPVKSSPALTASTECLNILKTRNINTTTKILQIIYLFSTSNLMEIKQYQFW